MPATDDKQIFLHYLQRARDAVVWKLDGLSEYDVRRPLLPTGTNLLGIVKHLIAMEVGYFGDVFSRPFAEPIPWLGPIDNSDMWATAGESREWLLDLYRRAWAHADETVELTDLDARGVVPWWPAERREPTLQRILVHMTAETHRHAGHADIVRELIDGAAGYSEQFDNLAELDWRDYYDTVEQAARAASQASTSQ